MPRLQCTSSIVGVGTLLIVTQLPINEGQLPEGMAEPARRQCRVQLTLPAIVQYRTAVLPRIQSSIPRRFARKYPVASNRFDRSLQAGSQQAGQVAIGQFAIS